MFVKILILPVYTNSVFFLLMNKITKNEIMKSASTAPPTAPSILAICLWLLCFLGVKIVTCGVWIEELLEKSLHIVVKVRHKFPDVLKIQFKSIILVLEVAFGFSKSLPNGS